MSNTQLYLAIGVPLVTNLLGILGLMKYMDAKFEPVNAQLKFIVDNVMLHHVKIAKLEQKVMNK